ncbi:hypothetical protein C7443_10911 [Plasticicumulans acidivorans]|uniref:Uncharacterized protein n=2 Tax=Plasticicumulans acidivorans TaxID=886464 RepID=A0A317MXA1_9GAMM|nr:hypothetical protein C7443_10911 [Plasticicumulans acidivorans]
MRPILSMALMLTPLSAVCAETFDHYKKADIEILAAQPLASDTTRLVYQPLLESLFYCPGAVGERKDGREKITLVRCSIHERCAVDFAAKAVEHGFELVLPAAPRDIDLVFSDGEVRLAD